MSWRVAIVGVVCFSVFTVVHAPSAGACSCVSPLPSTADEVGRADVSFVGRVVRQERIDPPVEDWINLVTYVRVEQPVKGVEEGEVVVVHGSDIDSSCGVLTLPAQGTVALALRLDTGRFVGGVGGYCQPAFSAADLLDVPRELPPTTPGPISLIVVGQQGPAQLVALDLAGQPVAYGFRARPGSTTRSVATCPGGRSAISIEADGGNTWLANRTLPTLAVEGTRALDAQVDGTPIERAALLQYGALSCLDREGTKFALSREGDADFDVPALVAIFDGTNTEPSVIEVGMGSLPVTDDGGDRWTGVEPRALVTLSSGGDLLERTELTALSEDEMAVSLSPAGDGSWWVVAAKPGPDGSGYRIFTTLVHLAADGTSKRWAIPTTTGGETFDARVHAGRLWLATNNGTATVSLPDPSTAATPVLTDLTAVDPSAYWSVAGPVLLHISAGVTRFVVDNGWEVIPRNPIGDVRYATFVVDGPTVDPATVVRAAPEVRFVSDQILTEAQFAQRFAITTTPSGSTTTHSESTNEPNEPKESHRGWTVAIGILVGTLSVGLGVAAARRRRR